MHRHLAILTALLCLALPIAAHASSPDSVFQRYVDAVINEDWPTAESLWLPEELTHAKRLEIEFAGIPLKVDCASPLFEHRAAIARGDVQYTVTDSTSAGKLVVKKLSVSSGPTVLEHTYLLTETKSGWRLTSPIYQTTRNWPVIETRFTRVLCPDSSLINQFALDAMDTFIDSLGTILQFGTTHWTRLTREKIDCYLAERDAIKELSGHDAHGLTYLPLDAIITSHLPHEHELVHEMINYRLKRLPMYTLPILQEGLAVAYGGRWGKTPNVIMQVGAFVLTSDIITLEDVLTYNGFHADASDLSYAVGGLFSRCLLESMGIAQFTILYRRLSGPQQYIRQLNDYEIRKAVEESTGQPWEQVGASCLSHQVSEFSHRGIDPCSTMSNAQQFSIVSRDGRSATVYEDSLHYYIEASGDMAGKTVGLCFESSTIFDDHVYRSRLFTQQFPDQPYDRQIVGIVFDSLEAGVYDYRTDMLVAKFASGFSMGESIWDAADRVVRFRVDKKVVPVDLKSGTLNLVW